MSVRWRYTGTGVVRGMYWRDWSDYECVTGGGGGDGYWRCEGYVLERLERL